MRSRLQTAALAALAMIAASVAPAAAQTPALQGTFVYVADGSDDVNKAIDQAISKMNFVVRSVARGRLRKTNVPYERLAISHSTDRVSIAADRRPAIQTPANGTPVKWTREDGEVFDVSTEWENGALEQTFGAPDGKRVNTFTLSPDGNTLTMKVTVSSPRLPKPLTYSLRYRRVG